MDMNEATAKAIQAERAIADVTVRELSARAGIPLSSLMRVLGAERDIKINQVAQLATALGVYPHELVEAAEQILARNTRAQGGGEVIALPTRGDDEIDALLTLNPAASEPDGDEDPDAEIEAQQIEP